MVDWKVMLDHYYLQEDDCPHHPTHYRDGFCTECGAPDSEYPGSDVDDVGD